MSRPTRLNRVLGFAVLGFIPIVIGCDLPGSQEQEAIQHLADDYLQSYLERYPRGTKAKEAKRLLEVLGDKGWR